MTQDIDSNPISNPPFIHPKKQSPAFIIIVTGEGQNIHHQFSCRIATLNDVVRYIQIPKTLSANNYRGIINTDDNEDEENGEITDAKDAILIEFQSVINDYLVKSMLEPEMKLSIQLCHDLNSHEVHHTIRSSYTPIAHLLSDIPHSIDVFKSHPGTGLRLYKGDNIGLFDWTSLLDTKSGRLDSTSHKDDCIGLVFHELKMCHKTNPGEFTGKKTDKDFNRIWKRCGVSQLFTDDEDSSSITDHNTSLLSIDVIVIDWKPSFREMSRLKAIPDHEVLNYSNYLLRTMIAAARDTFKRALPLEKLKELAQEVREMPRNDYETNPDIEVEQPAEQEEEISGDLNIAKEKKLTEDIESSVNTKSPEITEEDEEGEDEEIKTPKDIMSQESIDANYELLHKLTQTPLDRLLGRNVEDARLCDSLLSSIAYLNNKSRPSYIYFRIFHGSFDQSPNYHDEANQVSVQYAIRSLYDMFDNIPPLEKMTDHGVELRKAVLLRKAWKNNEENDNVVLARVDLNAAARKAHMKRKEIKMRIKRREELAAYYEDLDEFEDFGNGSPLRTSYFTLSEDKI